MNVVSLTQQTSNGVISEQTPAAFRRTPKGRRQAESRHSCMALYNRQQVTFIRNGMTRVSFRASHQPTVREAALCINSQPPKPTKTSPISPPFPKSESNFRFVSGGDMGEVLGERGRLGGREPPLRKRGLSPSKVFPSPHSAK